MKFYSFSDLIHYVHIETRNNHWISQLTSKDQWRRNDGKYFVNYLEIPVSEDVWLLHHAMNKMDYLEFRKSGWGI